MKKERTNELIEGLEHMVKRAYTTEEKGIIMDQFKLEFANLCLKSNQLERRIQGIKVIAEMAKSIRYAY